MKVRLIGAVAVLSLLAVLAGSFVAYGNSAGNAGQSVALITNEAAVVNTHAAPDTPAFDAWCSLNGPCTPSVTQSVHDAATGQLRGTIYVWTKNFVWSADGNSVCFGEFIWFELTEGDVYTHSGGNGTCGAFIDPSLKAPTHITGAGQVIAGGGDGTIVGGTGRFSKWTGTYTDRVFVEFNFSGGANYYDQLFWSINSQTS